MMHFKTKGTCSREILFDVDEGIIKDVKFIGGCAGNAQGISRLVEGMSVDEAVQRLKGIRCGKKQTSCPDQLAIALSAVNGTDEPKS